MHLHHLIPRTHGDTPRPRGGVRGVIPSKQSCRIRLIPRMGQRVIRGHLCYLQGMSDAQKAMRLALDYLQARVAPRRQGGASYSWKRTEAATTTSWARIGESSWPCATSSSFMALEVEHARGEELQWRVVPRRISLAGSIWWWSAQMLWTLENNKMKSL